LHFVLMSTTTTGWLAELFPALPVWLIGFVVAGFHTALIGLFFGLPAFVFIWAERKISARIQDRLGPTHAGGRFGWLQSLADGIKLVQKEDLAPQVADHLLFRCAPYVVVMSVFVAFAFVPFSEGWVAVGSDAALFLVLAILSLQVLGVVLAGYASGSKWSLFGGMREAAQMVSYEIPLGLTAVIPVVVTGTMNLNDMVAVQSGGFWNWLIFHDPFCFLAFFTFFTVTLASNKRAPFDLAEAESELVGGFHTEYSGMRWSYFFLAEYAAMFLVSMLGAMLFLGGWWTGLPWIDRFLVAVDSSWSPVWGITRVAGLVVLMVKTSLLVSVQIWIRWTLPRLRIDQVMTTCLKYLLPITCALFLGASLWPLFLATTLQRTTLLSRPIGERMPGRPVLKSVSKPVPSGEQKSARFLPSAEPHLAATKRER